MQTIGLICSEPIMKRMLILELSKKYNVISKTFNLSDVIDCVVFDFDNKIDKDYALSFKHNMILGITKEAYLNEEQTDFAFLVRPFLTENLFNKVENILNRKASLKITQEDIHLPTLVPPKSVMLKKDLIALSEKEYKLLEYLLTDPSVPKSRADIVTNVWDNTVDSNIIDVYMHYLRKKLEEPYNRKIIFTVRNKGYILR